MGESPAGSSVISSAARVDSFPRYLITENGAAMPDLDVVDGRVIDNDRLEYIAGRPCPGRPGEIEDASRQGRLRSSRLATSAPDGSAEVRLVAVDVGRSTALPRRRTSYANVARTGEIS